MSKVVQTSKSGEFIRSWDNISEAGSFLGIPPTNISAVINGRRSSAGGFKWGKGEKQVSDYDFPIMEIQRGPDEGITNSREWQEFLSWKTSNSKDRDYTPGEYIVMGCTHVPFHHKKLFNATLNLIEDLQPTGLVLAGDFMDMNSISSHDRGQKPIAEHVTLGWEYEQGNIALDMLESVCDYEQKHYVFGNHEDRYWRHVRNADVAKLGDALTSPTKALKLKERGYNIQENWKDGVVYLGKHLEVIHGQFCNIHTAKKHIDAFRTSMVFFHTHRLNTYVEGNVGGFNLGWGGDVTSPAFGYATKAMKKSWKNAFGKITIDELGGFHVEPIVWTNDRFYHNGKKYTGE